MKKLLLLIGTVLLITSVLFTGCDLQKNDGQKETSSPGNTVLKSDTSPNVTISPMKTAIKESQEVNIISKKPEKTESNSNISALNTVKKYIDCLNNNNKDDMMSILTEEMKNYSLKQVGYVTIKVNGIKQRPFKSAGCPESILDEYKRLGEGSMADVTEENIASIWVDGVIDDTKYGSLVGEKCIEFWVIRYEDDSPWLIDSIGYMEWTDLLKNSFNSF